MNPAEASARAVDELTDEALPGLPMTDVDRVESAILADCAEAERTIQRLGAQLAAATKLIEALAELVAAGGLHPRWHKHLGACVQCDAAYGTLQALGFGDRIEEWSA